MSLFVRKLLFASLLLSFGSATTVAFANQNESEDDNSTKEVYVNRYNKNSPDDFLTQRNVYIGLGGGLTTNRIGNTFQQSNKPFTATTLPSTKSEFDNRYGFSGEGFLGYNITFSRITAPLEIFGGYRLGSVSVGQLKDGTGISATSNPFGVTSMKPSFYFGLRFMPGFFITESFSIHGVIGVEAQRVAVSLQKAAMLTGAQKTVAQNGFLWGINYGGALMYQITEYLKVRLLCTVTTFMNSQKVDISASTLAKFDSATAELSYNTALKTYASTKDVYEQYDNAINKLSSSNIPNLDDIKNLAKASSIFVNSKYASLKAESTFVDAAEQNKLAKTEEAYLKDNSYGGSKPHTDSSREIGSKMHNLNIMVGVEFYPFT